MAEHIDEFGGDRGHTRPSMKSVRNRPPQKGAVLDQALSATFFHHYEAREKEAEEYLNLLLATRHNAPPIWTWDERGGGGLLEDGYYLDL